MSDFVQTPVLLWITCLYVDEICTKLWITRITPGDNPEKQWKILWIMWKNTVEISGLIYA